MTSDKQLLEQTLEFFGAYMQVNEARQEELDPQGRAILDKLRAAIEQAEKQEPVAYEYGDDVFWHDSPDINDYIRANGKALVYTTPPAAPVQEPEYWNVIDPAGNIVASETDAIRGWARIAGGYKPTVEGLLGFHDQGWRVLPKATPTAAQPAPVQSAEERSSVERGEPVQPEKMQDLFRKEWYSFDPSKEMSDFSKSLHWLENSPNTRDKKAASELRRLHEESIRLKNCLFQMQEAAKQLAAQPAPVQEPIGYFTVNDYDKWEEIDSTSGRPLYEHPAAQPAVPLTDEQRRAIIAKLSEADYADGDEWDNALFDAIEAAHGIKENT